MDESLRQAALEVRHLPSAGKIGVTRASMLLDQRDRAPAYSPGVAAACDAIVADAHAARTLTAPGSLVAVVTQGTAMRRPADLTALAVVDAGRQRSR